ncbi:NACHT, LRR and PYD domains-containing protein 3-like isoform X4 [Heterodontus francisci]|uniref:NACHT, LRR and PYD domains-containing protein 3-like isoform X4 n=1 Tax=Heterodontus francisci TaxID=7792 RepID=UPI00355B1EB2
MRGQCKVPFLLILLLLEALCGLNRGTGTITAPEETSTATSLPPDEQKEPAPIRSKTENAENTQQVKQRQAADPAPVRSKTENAENTQQVKQRRADPEAPEMLSAQPSEASADNAAKDTQDAIVLACAVCVAFLGGFGVGSTATYCWMKKKYVPRTDAESPDPLSAPLLEHPEAPEMLSAQPSEGIERQHKTFLQEQTTILEVTGENQMSKTCLLDEHYTEVMIVPSLGEPQMVETELKAQGRKLEEKQGPNIGNVPENVQLDQLLGSKDATIDRTRTTIVFGDAGIGKSIIIQKILRDWATGKIYHQFQFVFRFKFTQLTLIKVRTTLSRLILNSYPYLRNHLEKLWKDPGKILFIFDDLDEFEQTVDFKDVERNNTPQNQCSNPECCCLVSDIVRCLIQGQLLKGSSVLIMSPPWKLESLGNSNIHRRFKILGFSPEKMKEYFQCYLRDPNLEREAIETIKLNDTLDTLYYNPLYCSVCCSLVESHKTAEERERQPITSTRVYTVYFENFLNRCGYDAENTRNSLLKLCELAYQGIGKKTAVFEADKFNELELELSNFITAFIVKIRDNDLRSAAYKFRDTVMQDFVAALLKSLRTKPNELKQLLDEGYRCGDDRFNSFSRFLVGLSSRKSTDQLESKLGKFPAEVTQPVSDWLTRNVKTCAQNLDDGQSQRKFLNICHSFAEFEDRNLMAAALAPIKKIKFTKCPLKSYDCAVLSTVLMNLEIIEEMDFSTCGIQDAGIHQLQSILHKCKILRLNENNLQDSGVKCLFKVLEKNDCKVQTLELKSNALTDDCAAKLVSAISKNGSLMELDLSNDNQRSEQSNRLTDKSVPTFLQLYQTSTNLKEIRLQNNQFSANRRHILKSRTASSHLTIITD